VLYPTGEWIDGDGYGGDRRTPGPAIRGRVDLPAEAEPADAAECLVTSQQRQSQPQPQWQRQGSLGPRDAQQGWWLRWWWRATSLAAAAPLTAQADGRASDGALALLLRVMTGQHPPSPRVTSCRFMGRGYRTARFVRSVRCPVIVSGLGV
jgi:hypothetical protein